LLDKIALYKINEVLADKFGITNDEVKKLLLYFDSCLPFEDVKNKSPNNKFSLFFEKYCVKYSFLLQISIMFVCMP